MRTRLIVSALTAGALALGSVSSFAHGRDAGRRFEHRGHAGQVAAHHWREHQRHGWYAPPVAYAPPLYAAPVYDAPVYAPPVYAPPVAYAPAPAYYGYADPTDAAFAAIVGGVMAAAIANSH